ncbi:histidine kinase [Solibacillus sp. R5-41]|uniref:putative bifunctional diguanylate cyclase/phosphodiesterase n=1 Tax=Solibacillus sp. R5-41 TaxID=2048654 RepID=UPI000C128F61|nr:bifunctional diguanylate cyclase/phosphodiesterase [Solibacillus sp. R5-41]ATP41159.1 histidine kinase [Solibacillus sp. R5-41]
MHINPLMPLSRDNLLIWLKSFSDQLSKGTLILDFHDKSLPILHINNDFLQLTGYSKEALIGENISILNGQKTNLDLYNELLYSLKYGVSNKFTLLHYSKCGSAFWNRIIVHPIRDEHNAVEYLLLTCEDHTELELNKMLSKLEHEVYAEIDNGDNLQSILTLISEKIESYYIRNVYCTIHLIEHQNKTKSIGSNLLPLHIIRQLELLEVASYMGYNTQAVYLKELSLTENVTKLFQDHQLNLVKTSWTKPILTPQQQISGILTLWHQENTELKQDDLNYLNRLALLIQLAINYAEQKLELQRLAFYDIDTNIPNVHYFQKTLKQWIDDGNEGFIAIIHPSEFNNLVDLYGRKAGDDLLRQIVERLQQETTPGEEFIARFSNSIIVANKSTVHHLKTYESRLQPLTFHPYLINEKKNYITLKIGVSNFHHASVVEDCIHQADIALTKARSINGTNVALFEEDSNKKLAEEMETFNQLVYGIQNGEFTVHLQPKINITTLEIEGFEALSRWNSHVLGNVSPAIFIPIAEKTGKIKDIDSLNFKTVLSWLQKRVIEGKKVYPIAINISPDYFYDVDFLKDIARIFEQFNVPANYIRFEVTESIELVDFTKAKDILQQLKEIGIESSIDDFGVGFSSLSYLPHLPFSEIKIDRSFIKSMKNPGVYAVVQTIIQLAQNIYMRAIAEGIETEEQLKMLQSMGCPAGQGYYFYKPMPIIEIDQLIDLHMVN